MSKIISLGVATPPHHYTQEQILAFMLNSLPFSTDEAKKVSLMYQRSGIQFRHCVLPDFYESVKEKVLFSGHLPGVDERLNIYHQHATPLAQQALEICLDKIDCSREITHLITVSCTGMSAPGIDIDLVKKLSLPADVQRTSVNFMGCYAAIHGLKMADYIARTTPHAVVAVVCIELCSIHFQPTADFEQVAANLLFADGAAAALVVADSHPKKGLALKGFYSQIMHNGVNDMAWNISQNGFLMRLSAYIPTLVEKGIGNLLHHALSNNQIGLSTIKHWAIHPGGKKILESVEKELQITPEHLWASYRVLAQYGNMSSPTILFVLDKIWQSNAVHSSDYIFGAAFGPGITLESMILQAE